MFSMEPLWELLGRAANACALRQAAYASNIANAGVEGYRPLRVEFDTELAKLQAANSQTSQADAAWAQTDAAQPAIVSTTGAAVKLDEEMASMAQNAVRYQALLGAFERTTGLLQMAIKEGREG